MTTALERGEGSASRSVRFLPSGKTRYPLYRRLRGPQVRSGQVRKISPPQRDSIPGPSSVAIHTELSGPRRVNSSNYITYSDCVFVALVTQNAKRMSRIILSSLAFPAVSECSTLSHKQHDFQQKENC
jgi:hypothetical protein